MNMRCKKPNTPEEDMYEKIDDILIDAGIQGSDAQVEQISIAVMDLLMEQDSPAPKPIRLVEEGEEDGHT
jgi:hypothetical protein